MKAVVEVTGGQIRGMERGGVLVFSGIPYAGSPAGKNRWKPPVAPESWHGIREADQFGPIAPQPPPTPGMTIPGDPTEQDENCLTLNVWTPALDAGRRPVMVWIHGGGFTTGTGSALLYRGGDLCREGDVVVVTINYRLGALGFLGHPALAVDDGGEWDGAFGNWGLMDQVTALRWVRDHIESFGGDPGEVTIFGESAGAMSISALLAVPSARGLFARAIIESGPVYTQSAEVGSRVASELAGLVGVHEVNREELCRLSAADLVEAGSTMQNRLPPPGEIPLPFLPVIDGVFLPSHPEDAVAAGSAAGIPLLVGTNRDELTFFSIADRRLSGMDDAGVDTWFDRAAPDLDSEAVLEVYRSARSTRGDATTPQKLWIAAGSDFVFRWPTLRLAEAQLAHESRVFAYLFTWESPAFGGVLGSCHALEIPFVTGAVRHEGVMAFSGRGADVDALSRAMRHAWLAFARTGNPTVSDGDRGEWLAWDPDRQATMIFGPDKGIGGGNEIGPLGGVRDAPLGLETDAWRKVDARH